MTRPHTWACGILTAAALLCAGRSVALDAGPKCESGKNKEAGKLAFCLQKAEAKLLKTGDTVKYAADVKKCTDKFGDKWGRLEDKASGECPTTGDRVTVQAIVEDCVDAVARALDADSCTNKGGVEVGPACWFLGDPNESCDDVCTGTSLSYDSATADYMSDPNNCNDVLDALGAPSAYLVLLGPGGCGCFYCAICDGGLSPVRYLDSTNSSCSDPKIERACACK